MVPKVLGELLTSTGNGFPIGWTCVVPESETGVHDQGVIGYGAVHADNIGVVLYSRKCALDIIVPGVAIMGRVGDGKIPVPCAKVVERVGKVKGRFVTALACPVIDSIGARPGAKAAVR